MSIRIYVDTRRILNNLELLREDAKEKLLCAVVKADAYGHGIIRVSKEVEPYVDYFAVAVPIEGKLLRSSGIKKPILVLSFLESDAELCVENDLTVGVTDEVQIKSLIAVSSKIQKVASVHVQVDSGMHRFGIKSTDKLVEMLDFAENKIFVTGIYSHVYSRDSYDTQISRFISFESILKERYPHAISHISSSAYIQNNIGYGDMVRPGLALYGYPKGRYLPAMQIESEVLNVVDVEGNDVSGYDGIFKAGKSGSRLAIIEGGYADGILRNRRGTTSVLYRGQLLRIVSVCMDSVSVIADGIDIHRGDKVYFVGESNGVEYYFDDIAKEVGTIPYELMTNTSKRARRDYVDFKSRSSNFW